MYCKIITVSIAIVLCLACTHSKKQKNDEPAEDKKAKTMLQGVWIDDDTDIPLLRVEGDTIYYNEPMIAPVYFNIRKDTLYMYSNQRRAYHIHRQTDYSFWFHTDDGSTVKLHKSENLGDTLAFPKTADAIPVAEVVEKDSVVTFKGTRYRAYVYINPSKMKVVKTSYSDEGLSVDNVYYDNVMHICVYEGRNRLYNSNITKQMFSEVVPEEFLEQSILTDMNFVKVDNNGFHYQAAVCIPNSVVCNMVDLLIGFDWELKISAVSK